MGKTNIGKNAGKTPFEALLGKISLEEYRAFMRHYAARNQDFQTEVEVYFADKDDRIDISEKYDELIQKLIAKHSDRGFVAYRAASALAKDVDQLLDTGRAFVAKANYRDAFGLTKPVLRALIEVQAFSDDSSGNLGGAVMNTVELIENIAGAPEVAPSLKEQMFDFLQEELADQAYFHNGDFGYELFSIYRALALQLGKTEEFGQFVDARIAALTGQFDTYDREYYLEQRISFAQATGKTEEAEKIIQQHLDIVEVRQGEVDKAIARHDFPAAKELIAGGIRVAQEKDQPGTVVRWQKELLRVATLENDTDTIRHYAKQLAFDRRFDATYYDQWKKTYPPGEWKSVIEQYLAEKMAAMTRPREKKKGAALHVSPPDLLYELGPVYIAEKYWDRLLALVQQKNNLQTTLYYHEYLHKHYPQELLNVYLPALRHRGDQVNNRSEYAELAGLMKKVMADIPKGKVPIKDLARELIAKYPKRPAFIDELNAVLRIA
jgi:hypothetical protein